MYIGPWERGEGTQEERREGREEQTTQLHFDGVEEVSDDGQTASSCTKYAEFPIFVS